MNTTQITYLVFGIVLLIAIVIDLGLFTKKDKKVSIKDALWTSLFWIALGLAFGIFVWFEKGPATLLWVAVRKIRSMNFYAGIITLYLYPAIII